MVLLVVIAASGCTSMNSTPGWETEYPSTASLVAVGVHPRYAGEVPEDVAGERYLEFEMHFIHVGDRPLDSGEFEITANLEGNHVRDLQSVPGDSNAPPWLPGEARQVNVVFPTDEFTAVSGFFMIAEHGLWIYKTTCYDMELNDLGPCGIESGVRIQTRDEPAYYPQLLSCCEWLPPPFDVHDTRCVAGLTETECTFVVWNYSNATHEGALTVHLNVTREGQPPQALATQEVSFGEPLNAGENRTYTILFDVGALDKAPLDGLAVEVQAARVDLPKSIAHESVAVTFDAVSGVGFG